MSKKRIDKNNVPQHIAVIMVGQVKWVNQKNNYGKEKTNLERLRCA